MENNYNIKIGCKFYRYLDDQEEPEVIRILKFDKEKGRVKYLDKDKNKNSMDLTELADKYKKLRPDGVIIFSVVKLGETNDVIIGLSSLERNNAECYAICRQAISDIFTNNIKKAQQTEFIGVSVNRDTCPPNIDFQTLFFCDGIQSSIVVEVYLDDTLDDILNLINPKKFDTAIRNLKYYVQRNNRNALGFNETLKDLLISNNFMYDFRRCFNITEVPFYIDEETEGLSADNILFLENELKVNIMETYVIRYTKEIDLRSIRRDYILVSSAQEEYSKIYIVGYDKADGKYIPRTSI